MDDSKINRGLVAATVALALGLFLFIILQIDQKIDGVIFTAIFIVPVVVFCVAAGLVREFTGPGGWGAKFHETANDTVQIRNVSADAEAEFEPIQNVCKESVAALKKRRTRLRSDHGIVLTFQMGRKDYYTESAVATYLSLLMGDDARLMVVFVDGGGRFLASVPGSKLLASMAAPSSFEMQQSVIRAIETSAPEGIETLKELIRLSQASIASGVTNSEALKLMLEENVDTVIAVDRENKPIGIVRRDDIMAKLLIKLAAD